MNFIMTGNPTDSHHMFRSVTEKATNSDASYRYADAEQLSVYFEKSVKFHQQEKTEETALRKIKENTFDEDVESYIYEQSGEKICELLMVQKAGFFDALLLFMEKDESHAQHIIQSIDGKYKEVCGRSFVAYDPFAQFAYWVLRGTYSFVVNEIAAQILRYVAKTVNRFTAMRLLSDIKDRGVEPLIEDILNS